MRAPNGHFGLQYAFFGDQNDYDNGWIVDPSANIACQGKDCKRLVGLKLEQGRDDRTRETEAADGKIVAHAIVVRSWASCRAKSSVRRHRLSGLDRKWPAHGKIDACWPTRTLGDAKIRPQSVRPDIDQATVVPRKTIRGMLPGTVAVGSSARSTFRHRQARVRRSCRWPSRPGGHPRCRH